MFLFVFVNGDTNTKHVFFSQMRSEWLTIDRLAHKRHYEYAVLYPLHATSKIKTVPCDPRPMATADSEPCTTRHIDPGYQCRHFQHTSDAPIKSSFGPDGAIVQGVFSYDTFLGREVWGGAGGGRGDYV